MRKIYRALTEDQKRRGIVFSSCLSYHGSEEGHTIHEVHKDDHQGGAKIERLKDDRFFNRSPFKYNIIRD
jgi:hypothetical protein